MASKTRKFLLYGIAFIGTVGFIGPLIITLFSIFAGTEQAPAPATPTTQNQAAAARAQQEIAAYEKILKREPDNPNALSNLASLYLQQFQFTKAVPLVEKLARQQPENIDLQLRLAALYQISGQPAKAKPQIQKVIPALEKLAKEQPDNTNIKQQLAQLYQEVGRNDRALATYDQLIAKNGKDVQALLGKAELLLAQGDKKNASDLFKRAEAAAATPEEKERIRKQAESRLNPPKPTPPAQAPGSTP